MKAPNVSLGLDVGGSHVAASAVDMSFAGRQPMHLVRREIDSFGSASSIVAAIGDCIGEAVAGVGAVTEIGVAFPGPFNYAEGICTVMGVGGKFEQMFGLHLAQALKDATGLHSTAFSFFNDAHCFAAGAYAWNGLAGKRTVFLTLGSGFGSSFMERGRLVTQHAALPASGAFYDQPFGDALADDYFSTRWFHYAYERATGHAIASVRELAGMDSEVSRNIFDEFGSNLAEFLLPWLQKFECDELVIGGSIARANHLFFSTLENRLKLLEHKVQVFFCDDTEACILAGAAQLARQEAEDRDPVGEIAIDARFLAHELRHERIAVIDGHGTGFREEMRQQLHAALKEDGRRVFWYNANACLKTSGTDRSTEDLENSFDQAKVRIMRPDPSVDLCIAYGTGAALCGWDGKQVNIDAALPMKPVL